MENNQGNDPLGDMFQTMFGGGRRRRRRSMVPETVQGMGGYGGDGPTGYDYGGKAPEYPGQYGYIWRGDTPVSYDPNLGVPGGYSVFHRGQGALAGLPGNTGLNPLPGYGNNGNPLPGYTGVGNSRGTPQTGMAPPGAPWFASAAGTVFANGQDAPYIGGNPGVDPTGQYYIPPGQPGGAASIPWQGSWADPNSPNFFLSQFGFQTPNDYFNPGQWQWGQGPALYGNAQSHGGAGSWGNGWTGGPQGQGPSPQGPAPGGGYGQPPGGAQGGSPPMTPPGGNGPTGPASNLPSGFQMGPNGQVGNFNMYAGMPYAGGMGPYSGWLPPAVGSQVDYGAPGTAPSPQDAASAAPGTYAPGPTVQPGQYANLGMPQGGGQSGGTWGTNGAQGWGYW
jgi:hypothetical protein